MPVTLWHGRRAMSHSCDACDLPSICLPDAMVGRDVDTAQRQVEFKLIHDARGCGGRQCALRRDDSCYVV
ncbi:hypothetical protein FH972_022793 [Carpinus fangiana]|uniref:Uncharacterized protein n=1 Tax=Carpinus fangiana TaxID=176857 RepID=A0A5N6KVH8_9ROSI|nr:hypothetical protein FH972_022793 [Carpinus fangiana]